jgi:hypothetical protein
MDTQQMMEILLVMREDMKTNQATVHATVEETRLAIEAAKSEYQSQLEEVTV